MTFSARRSLRHLVALLVAVVLLAACSEGSDDGARGEPGREEGGRDTKVLGQTAVKRTRLAVIGDYGGGTQDEHRVAQAIKQWTEEKEVAGLVTTGDNVYPSGHPDDFDAAWHEPYGWIDETGLLKVASLGNHDIRTDDGGPVMELLDMPARFYKQHFPAIDVFVLDTTRKNREPQKEWLRKALRGSNTAWQVAVFHHPLYNCGKHGGGIGLRKDYRRILRKGGVDLVLNGHDHNYQRFKNDRGVTYVITGGGGYELYPLGKCPDGVPPLKVGNGRNFHFVKLTATKAELRLKAVTPTGKVIDNHSVPD